jgi:hypothetical protein
MSRGCAIKSALQLQQCFESAATLTPHAVQFRQELALPAPQCRQNLAVFSMRSPQLPHFSVIKNLSKDMEKERWLRLDELFDHV